VKINVHIERLILEGLPVTGLQGPQVRGALEKELGRLLAKGGVSREFRDGIAVPYVRAGTIGFSKESRPSELGRSIARAVHGGIGMPMERAEAGTARVPGAKPGGQR